MRLTSGKLSGLGADWRALGVAVTLIVSVAVIGLGGLVFHQRHVDLETRQSVEESYIRRVHLLRIFSYVQDVETSARGYLLRGEPDFLVPYQQAIKLIPREMAWLKTQAVMDHREAEFARLEALVNRKLELSQRAIALRASHASPAAIVGKGRGRDIMREIRQVLGDWQDHEGHRREALIAAAERADQALTAGLAALTAAVTVLLALTVGGAVLILRSTARAAAELEQSRDEAEAANRAKSAFLAMMSHELRTPLNGVLGMTHVLSTTDLNEQQRAHLEIIGSSGRSLLMILNDVLDLSKIDAGKLDVETVPFALPDLLESVVSLWRPLAAEKGLSLRMTLEPGLPQWVEADPTRLRQVLTNLLSNAVKFTDKGAIRLQVRTSEGGVLAFDVADTGPGIAPGAETRLFSDFSQADSSTSRRFGGTGLGLSISRRLCRLMGGDLTVSSVEGHGATFHGRIRVGPAQAPAAEAHGGPEDLPQLRVLAVDDNPANRVVAYALLGALGMTVTLAGNGEEALEILRTQSIDLVFMDINMPVMDGGQALAAIRAGQAGDPNISVIALTADAMIGDREKHLAQGFDDHLAKPIQPAQLAMALSAAARRLAKKPAPPVYEAAFSSL